MTADIIPLRGPDWDAFAASLDGPPQPNEALKALLAGDNATPPPQLPGNSGQLVQGPAPTEDERGLAFCILMANAWIALGEHLRKKIADRQHTDDLPPAA